MVNNFVCLDAMAGAKQKVGMYAQLETLIGLQVLQDVGAWVTKNVAWTPAFLQISAQRATAQSGAQSMSKVSESIAVSCGVGSDSRAIDHFMSMAGHIAKPESKRSKARALAHGARTGSIGSQSAPSADHNSIKTAFS